MLLTQPSGLAPAKATTCAPLDTIACRQMSGACAGPSSRTASVWPLVGPRVNLKWALKPYQSSHARMRYERVVRFVASGELQAVEGAFQPRVADGASQSGASAWVPGLVHRVGSPDELKDFLRTFQNRLVCLMCKATGCRPCKAFERKYKACAEEYQDVVFLEIYGDETIETRKLMIALQVKSTPTFMMFKHKGPVHTHSGTSDSKLRNALNQHTGRQEEELMSETES